MDEECIEKHIATLRSRYGDRKLREAAVRREHLQYRRIHIGDNPGSGRVKFLIAQMHQAYYFGFSEAACILAGTLLEQGLTHRLEACLDQRGPLLFMKNGQKKWMQTRQDLLELELVDMLDLARSEKVLSDGKTLLLAHEIRWIRNMVVHEKIPLFRDGGEKYLEMKVMKSRKGRARYATIRLERSEVSDLNAGTGRPDDPRRGGPTDLTAYFCVSRTRLILRHLFNEGKTEEKASDESCGNLLLWKES